MKRERKDIAKIMADGKPVDAALAAGAREALVRHMLAGQPIAEWKDGKTVWIPPEEIEERIKKIDAYLASCHRAARIGIHDEGMSLLRRAVPR